MSEQRASAHRSGWRGVLAVAVGLEAVLGGLAAWSGGFGAHVGGTDLYGYFVPKYRAAAAALWTGELPLWNPFEFCGLPLLGMAQGAVLYPPVPLAFSVAEPFTAVQILYQVHMLAYLLLLVCYLSRAGLSLVSAATAAALAVVCVFNGLAGLGADHPSHILAMTWLAAMLLAWQKFGQGAGWSGPLVALFFGIQWLTGYPQYGPATAIAFGLVVVLSPGPPLVRRLMFAGWFVLLGTLVGAIQIAPLIETARESVRADWTAQQLDSREYFKIHGPGWLIGSLTMRYGGTALVLAGIGLLQRHPWRWAWAAGLIWAAFALNPPFSLLYELPLFSSFRSAFEWDVIETLFFACLAGVGVAHLREARARYDVRAAVATAVVVAATLAVGNAPAAAAAAACALCVPAWLRNRGAT